MKRGGVESWRGLEMAECGDENDTQRQPCVDGLNLVILPYVEKER